MPDVERIADEPEPDHHPVRKNVPVEERVLPSRNHEHRSHYGKKRLVSREVLTVEREYRSEYQRKTDSREDVPAEPHAVSLFGILQQHSREIRSDLLRNSSEHFSLVKLKPGKKAPRHQLPEPQKRRVEGRGWIPLHRMELKTERGERSNKRQREDVEVELIRYKEHKRPDEIELLLNAQ